MKNTELRSRLLLAVQVALLGAINPSIRCVACGFDDSTIRLRVVFDDSLAYDSELWEEVTSEIISHFPDYEITLEIEHALSNTALSIDRNLILTYLRNEKLSGCTEM